MRLHCKHLLIAFGIILVATILPQTARGQVQLPPLLKGQWLDSSGKPLAGGCVFSYVSGTSTPLSLFTDSTGLTPQPNPTILDSSGRPPLGTDLWMLGQAYRIKLVSAGGTNCSTGTQIFLEDGINPSSASLLSSANTWTNTNQWNSTSTFAGPVNFNVGFTSLGPNTLGGGGSLTGTYSGSPIFSGVPSFSSGFLATTGSFSGQITSTVAGGTAPFVITSSTVTPNLNAALLNGNTFPAPGPIGGTTPAAGTFTTATVNTSLVINGSTAQTGVQGTDTKLMSAGTFTAPAAGQQVCLDANFGATNVSCTGGGFTRISTGSLGGTSCTTGASSFATCTSVITITPTQADTAYIPGCSGITPSDPRALIQTVAATSTSSITATVITEGSVAVSFGNIQCWAIHP